MFAIKDLTTGKVSALKFNSRWVAQRDCKENERVVEVPKHGN